jgi:hypothetical protein
MTETPAELLDIESQLRSLRANAPQLVILRAKRSRAADCVGGLCLLFGLIIGGVTVDQIRPVPPPVEIVRIVEVPVEIQIAETGVQRHPREGGELDDRHFSLDSRFRGNDELDAMFEQYNRRAKQFAKADWVAAVPRQSSGSIDDPSSAYRLRQTLDL